MDMVLNWKDRDRIEDGRHFAPPDLAIEVPSSSESRRRKEEKLEDYASLGVPEAWVLSPQAESVEVRVLRDGKLGRTEILVAGTLRPTGFPGASLQVESIWPR